MRDGVTIAAPDLRLGGWTEGCDGAVDEFVSGHPAGLVYYLSAYRRFLMRMQNCRCETMIAWHGRRVVGVLPAMSMDGPYGTVLNSLPFFGSNGGVLAADADVAATLRKSFDERASSCAAATWISNPFVESLPPAHDFTDERISQWTDLTAWDAGLGLPRGIESSARRNLSKAVSEGITVQETR